MYRYGEVTKLPVTALSEGQVVGTVGGFAINPDTKHIRWLSVDSCGRLHGRHWVAIENVQSFDEHGVTINKIADVVGPKEAKEAESIYLAHRDIIGKRVATQHGLVLGELRDFEFDPSTWELTKLIIPPGKGIFGNGLEITIDHLVAVLPDLILVGQAFPVPAGRPAPRPNATTSAPRARKTPRQTLYWELLTSRH